MEDRRRERDGSVVDCCTEIDFCLTCACSEQGSRLGEEEEEEDDGRDPAFSACAWPCDAVNVVLSPSEAGYVRSGFSAIPYSPCLSWTMYVLRTAYCVE